MSRRTLLMALLAATCAGAPEAAASAQQPPASRPVPSCEPESQWQGVDVSRHGGTIAAWTGGAVHLSRDGGARFGPVPAPEHFSALAIGAGGLLYMVDSASGLHVLRPDGSTVRRPFPYANPGALAVRGSRLAALAEGPDGGRVLVTSVDGGRRFRLERDVDWSTQLFVEEDGVFHTVDVEVNTCTSSDILEWIYRDTAPEIGRPSTRASYSLEQVAWATRFYPGAHGWLYAWDQRSRGLLAVTPSKALPVRGFHSTTPGWVELQVASNGRITLAAVDGRLLSLEGSRAIVLDRHLPSGLSGLVVDPEGRALALREHGGDVEVLRFSRRSGWSVLLPACSG